MAVANLGSAVAAFVDPASTALVDLGGATPRTYSYGFPLVALVTQRSVTEMGPAPGSPVTAHFTATAPHLLRHAKP